MDAFARGWASGSRSAFFDHFQPFVDPDVVLEQPPFPRRHGWDGFVELFSGLFELMPDLHGEVRSWTRTTTGVRIELDLVGTLRGRLVRLRTRDDLTLRDGRVVRRRARLDPRDLIRIAARPSMLPTVVRMCADAVRAARRSRARDVGQSFAQSAQSRAKL
ncbi:MAG: nuclear transport factor 2 family protein [Micromonosporaceae bacterium]